jgi:hypothetical protein
LLENIYRENAQTYATDLAFHFEQGKNVPQAIAYYLQAGENALRQSSSVCCAASVTDSASATRR